MTDRPRGIAGLEGREPIGAVLRVGRKDPNRGFPTDRDRFFIAWPYEDNSGERPLHPRYSLFNEAAPEHRRLVMAQLVHHTRSECFEHYLRNQVGPKGKPTPPGRAPWCEGNGVTARRYFGVKGDPSSGGEPVDDWREIPCPNDRCEYRQRVRGKVDCSPFARLLFRTVWANDRIPSMLTKLTTRAWSSTANILGLFEAIDRAAHVLGLGSDYSLMGFPFTIGLTEKTGNLAGKKTRYPVLVVAPQTDPISFFLTQADQRDRILTERPRLAITDREQQSPEVEAADFIDVTPGGHEEAR